MVSSWFGVCDAQEVNTKQTKTTQTSRSPPIPSALINTKGSYRQISMKRWGQLDQWKLRYGQFMVLMCAIAWMRFVRQEMGEIKVAKQRHRGISMVWN